MSAPPADGKVYEGWFVDDGGSGYKLSLGEFSKNGTLTFNEQMVNPYTYTQFIVTEEPFEDADPNEWLLQEEHNSDTVRTLTPFFFTCLFISRIHSGHIYLFSGHRHFS